MMMTRAESIWTTDASRTSKLAMVEHQRVLACAMCIHTFMSLFHTS